MAWGSPAFEAGLEHGDVVVSIDGKPYAAAAVGAWKMGDTVKLDVRRVDGRTVALTMKLTEDPRLVAVPIESANGTLTPAHQAFRAAWLGSRRK
jgi:predicted metalloprotease with PDZ domain